MPPLGYYTRAATGKGRDVIIDVERAPYIIRMFEMAAEGKGGRHIRQWLENNNVKTRGDKSIPLSMIYRMLGSSFYYGEFEYPKGSGAWYKGKHEPLISKSLFDRVHEQLRVPAKTKWGSKEFPFRQFLKCYGCGASIVGEEHTRHYANGHSPQFVYYHCSRQVDRNCKEPYISEKGIVDELCNMQNELIIDLREVEPGLRDAISKFTRMISVTNDNYDEKEMVGGYIKYVLREGSLFEKTRLIRNIKMKLFLHNKSIQTLDDTNFLPQTQLVRDL